MLDEIVATDYFDRVNVWEFEEEKERIYRREGARITAFATVDSQWIIFGGRFWDCYDVEHGDKRRKSSTRSY